MLSRACFAVACQLPSAGACMQALLDGSCYYLLLQQTVPAEPCLRTCSLQLHELSTGGPQAQPLMHLDWICASPLNS